MTPCMIYRLIAVNKEGRFIRKLYLDEIKLEELFVSNIDLEEAEYENEDWSLNQDPVFELMEPGTFVAVRSSTNAFEPFYLIEIVDKGIASYNITDSYGHMIIKGKRYAEGIYLEKQIESKKSVKYEYARRKDNVFIYLHEIVVTNIQVEQLQVNIEEYQTVLNAVL